MTGLVQALGQIAFAGGDILQSVFQQPQPPEQGACQKSQDEGGQRNHDEARQDGLKPHLAHASQEIALVEGHRQQPVGALDAVRAEPIASRGAFDLRQFAGLIRQLAQLRNIEVREDLGRRLQGQPRVRMGDDLAVAGNQVGEAVFRRAQGASAGDNVVQADIGPDDGSRLAVFPDGNRNAEHQAIGCRIQIGLGQDRLARLRRQSVPGPRGGIVVARQGERLAELHGFVRSAHVGDLEAPGMLSLQQERLGRCRQGHWPQRGQDRYLVARPAFDFPGVAVDQAFRLGRDQRPDGMLGGIQVGGGQQSHGYGDGGRRSQDQLCPDG